MPLDKYVKSNGLQIHYLDWENERGPGFIMLHGLRSFAHAWDPIARRLSEDYRVIAVDQRGRGQSDWSPTADYYSSAYVADLESLVEQTGLKNFILMGHSMGGINSIIYASRHPDHVRAAVIVDSAPAGAALPPGRVRLARELETTPVDFPSWEAAAAFWRSERPNISEEAMKIRLENTLRELPNGRIGWRYDLEGIRRARTNQSQAEQEDVWRHIENMRCPTLLVRGADSDILSNETATAMVARNPNFVLVEIPRASHYVYEDNPSAFIQELTKFLGGLT